MTNGFIWYELLTTDMKAATDFYRKAIGWTARDGSRPGQPYTILSAGDRMVAGIMPFPDEARGGEAKPVWLGYIAAADVDKAARKVTETGGTVHRQPEDIPDVGRFAVAADPQGAVFVLMTPATTPQSPEDPMAPGLVGWHELHAADWEAAFRFYEKEFGWSKADAIDMGPMGTYQLFAADGEPIGGMMTNKDVPRPFWLYYFNVADIDAACERISQAGGTIANGPMEVPGGAWIVNATDPQGAMFAIVGQRSQS